MDIGELTGILSLEDRFSGPLEAAANKITSSLSRAVISMTDMSDRFTNLAERTGIGVEALQKFDAVGATVGQSAESIAAGYRKLSQAIESGSATSTAAFIKLGISAEQLKVMMPDKQIESVIKALAGMEAGSARTALATQLLGRAGAALVPIGSDYDNLAAKAERLGFIMSKESIKAADDLGDAYGFLEKALHGVTNNIGDTITRSGALLKAVDALSEVVAQLSQFIHDNQAEITAWIDSGVNIAISAIKTLGEVVKAITGFINSLSPTTKTIIADFALFTVGVGSLALGALSLVGSLGALYKGFLIFQTNIVAAQAASFAFGNSVPILTARLWLMETATLANAAALGIFVIQAGAAVIAGAAIGVAIGTLIREFTGLGPVVDQAATALFALINGENTDLERGTQALATATKAQLSTLAAFKAGIAEINTGSISFVNTQHTDEEIKGLIDKASATQKLAAATAALGPGAAKVTELSEAIRILATQDKMAKATSDMLAYSAAVKSGAESLSGAKAAADLKLLVDQVKSLGGVQGVAVEQMGKLVKTVRDLKEAGQPVPPVFEGISRALDMAKASTVAMFGASHLLTEEIADVIPINDKFTTSLSTLATAGETTTTWPENAAKKIDLFAGVAVKGKDSAFDFSKALDTLKNAFELMGVKADSGLSKMIVGLQAGLSFAQQLGSVMEKNKGVKFGDWSDADKGKAAMAGLNTAMVAYQGSALSGAVAGGAFGAQFGPIGAGIGVVTGGLLGFIGSSQRAKEAMHQMTDEFVKSHGGMAALEAQAAKLGISLTQVFDAKNAKQLQAAVDDLNLAFQKQQEWTDLQAQAHDKLAEAVGRYKFSIEELGPIWNQQDLDNKAVQLISDYRLLNTAGVDHNAIIREMAPNLNKYVQDVMAAGVTIPEAMRPALQQMADMGELTDAAGNKINSLDGLTFGKTMSEALEAATKSIDRLVLALQGIKPPDITIPVHWGDPGPIPVGTSSTGGTPGVVSSGIPDGHSSANGPQGRTSSTPIPVPVNARPIQLVVNQRVFADVMSDMQRSGRVN